MSLQVASEASVNDLNRRLKEVPNADVLTIERFRPNIIVKGNTPGHFQHPAELSN